jgi:DNA mismatch endonuclease (patch repair protein)
MSDTFSKSQRSQIMRSVRSTGTSAERRCEAVLRSLKIKFTRNVANLPGKPDFVLKSSRLVVFVHGCFWHSHAGCKNAAAPTSNSEYWSAKLTRNRRRDRRVRQAIRRLGWRTAVIWECKLRNADSVANRLLKLTGASGKQLR